MYFCDHVQTSDDHEGKNVYWFWYLEKPRKEVSFYMSKVYACWSHQFVITLPQHGSEIKQSVKEFPFYQSLLLHSIIIFSGHFLSNDCSCLCTDLIFISPFCTSEKNIHKSRCNDPEKWKEKSNQKKIYASNSVNKHQQSTHDSSPI